MATDSPAVQLASTRREQPLPPDAPLHRRLLRGWQRVGRAVGMLLSRTVTTFLYVIVVPGFALGLKMFSDPLDLRPGSAHWTPLSPSSEMDDAQRGF